MCSLVDLRKRDRVAMLASSVALLTMACGGAPTNFQAVDAVAEAVTLSVANTRLQPGDALQLDARLSAPLAAVASRALVVTAGTDTEFVALYPGVCVIEGQDVECGVLIFAVAEGRQAEEFRRAISELGGTLVSPLNRATSRVGALRTPFGEEVRVRDALRSLDGIVDVQLAFMRYLRGQEPAPFGRGVLATSVRAGRSGDDSLQLAEGDKLRVTSAANPEVSVEVVVSRASP